MSRMFGILVIVFGTWIGFELYVHGTEQALGGALSFLDDAAPRDAGGTNLDRVRESATQAMRTGEERLERMIPD